MYLYIHGFSSSSQSYKAQVFKRWLAERGRESEWVCPDLSYQPAVALQQLEQCIHSSPTPPKIVGSSLGGFYTTVLVHRFNLKGVVINPAVHPCFTLRRALGAQTFWHSEETFEFTQQYLDDLEAMDILKPSYPENILMMQEVGDEVLDWRDAKAFYRDCHQLIFQGGDHSFTRFEDVIELIDRF